VTSAVCEEEKEDGVQTICSHFCNFEILLYLKIASRGTPALLKEKLQRNCLDIGKVGPKSSK